LLFSAMIVSLCVQYNLLVSGKSRRVLIVRLREKRQAFRISAFTFFLFGDIAHCIYQFGIIMETHV
jgi:hypothetical protein